MSEKASRLLSLVLRHKPDAIGIKLDKNGWASVSELLAGLKTYGQPISMIELENIVATNNKKRFSFNDSKTKIRANQGHSVEVDLELVEIIPPSVLYHGTARKSLDSIMKTGLKKMNRQHVHLSGDKDTAVNVGSRHGKPVVLIIDTDQMYKDGFKFYKSANGVWLTDLVPTKYITPSYE